MADQLDLAITKLVAFAELYAQPAASVIIEAARMEAWAALAGGAQGLVVAGLVTLGSKWLWKRRASDTDSDFMPWRHILSVCGFIFAALIVWTASWAFIDPRTWTTLAHPELWVAHRVFGL